MLGVSYGIRTRVAAVRGRCPRPLDEGDRSLTLSTIEAYSSRILCKVCARRVPKNIYSKHDLDISRIREGHGINIISTIINYRLKRLSSEIYIN